VLSLSLFLLQWPIERILERLRQGKVRAHWSFVIAFWAILAGVVLGAPAAVPFIYFQF
jgi:preprotein translocase subunit SecD